MVLGSAVRTIEWVPAATPVQTKGLDTKGRFPPLFRNTLFVPMIAPSNCTTIPAIAPVMGYPFPDVLINNRPPCDTNVFVLGNAPDTSGKFVTVVAKKLVG